MLSLDNLHGTWMSRWFLAKAWVAQWTKSHPIVNCRTSLNVKTTDFVLNHFHSLKLMLVYLLQIFRVGIKLVGPHLGLLYPCESTLVTIMFAHCTNWRRIRNALKNHKGNLGRQNGFIRYLQRIYKITCKPHLFCHHDIIQTLPQNVHRLSIGHKCLLEGGTWQCTTVWVSWTIFIIASLEEIVQYHSCLYVGIKIPNFHISTNFRIKETINYTLPQSDPYGHNPQFHANMNPLNFLPQQILTPQASLAATWPLGSTPLHLYYLFTLHNN